jgi:hypothetical protein
MSANRPADGSAAASALLPQQPAQILTMGEQRPGLPQRIPARIILSQPHPPPPLPLPPLPLLLLPPPLRRRQR